MQDKCESVNTKCVSCTVLKMRKAAVLASHWTSLGLILMVSFMMFGASTAQSGNLKTDLDNYINSLDGAAKESQPKGNIQKLPVSLMWGIGDASATIGRLFNHAIPSDAFKGEIISITVTEAAKDSTPSWLHFNKTTKQLKGVPSPSDAGRLYLEVVAKGHDNSQAHDVFSVSVQPETPTEYMMPPSISTNDNRPSTVRCKRELPETAVNVVIDKDLEQLSALDRVKVFEKMANFLNLNMDMFKLLPVGNKPVMDSNAYAFGPGDTKSPEHSGVLLSWLIGCGKVEKDHMKVLEDVQSTAADGRMKNALGHSVSGWHVTNIKQQTKARHRRAIRKTATPVPTESPPTRMVNPDAPSDSSEPMMHTVPAMVSPTFTHDIHPTKTLDMGEATQGGGDGKGPMMTKLPDGMMTKVVDVTPSGTPEPEPEPVDKNTQILPTKTYVMTDAPTDLPYPPPKTPHCPDDNETRGPYRTNQRMPPSLIFKAGKLSQYSVPNDLFFDCKYGDTRNLRLNLFMGKNLKVPPPNSWITLKHKEDRSWVVEGFPMGSNEGNFDYVITAINKDGEKPASDNFSVIVITEDGMSYEQPTHEVAMTLNNDYNTFTVADRLAVMKKISSVFGDPNTNSIKVLRVAEGSVIYAFTNTSLPTDACPVDGVKAMTEKLINEDGTINMRAKRRMKPYKLKGISVQPLGKCENNDQFPIKMVGKKPVVTEPKPATPEPTAEPPYVAEETTPEPGLTKGQQKDEEESEVWITTVVPAVVIVCILLIALVIACILYRKKRKGKMSLEDKNTFVNKGTPVIFPDEYDEKPNDSTKPLIMDDEKPPMPPPEYTRASSESSRSSDHKNDHDEIEEHEMEETDVNSPLYQPPPPVPASGGNKQPRPHVQPAHKDPAPYVPP